MYGPVGRGLAFGGISTALCLAEALGDVNLSSARAPRANITADLNTAKREGEGKGEGEDEGSFLVEKVVRLTATWRHWDVLVRRVQALVIQQGITLSHSISPVSGIWPCHAHLPISSAALRCKGRRCVGLARRLGRGDLPPRTALHKLVKMEDGRLKITREQKKQKHLLHARTRRRQTGCAAYLHGKAQNEESVSLEGMVHGWCECLRRSLSSLS